MAASIMNLDAMEALGLEVRSDGPDGLVVLRYGSVEAWIIRSSRDRNLWKATNVRGQLFEERSGSRILDRIAENLAPRNRA
jgi:hypothetical protein